MWQVFHLPLAFQGIPCRRRFVWQTARDRSCSDPELFPHQDSTDPSLLGIFSGSQADHHMASTPWWVWGELKWRKTKEKANKPHVKAPYCTAKIKLLMAFFITSLLAYLYQNLLSKTYYRLKGESRLAPLMRFQAVRPDLNELLMDTCSRRKTVWLPQNKDKRGSIDILVTELAILRGSKRVHSAFVVSLITHT